MKINKFLFTVAMAGSLTGLTTSCDDMLDKGNEYVIYADGHDLVTPADTTTSMLGIIHQLQGIAVRTNLLGEVRADLVTLNDNATIDLKNLAANDANVTGDDDANAYNLPRDYYAVINNCNYYLAHADSLAHNNSGKYYFKNEIAQVHSIRAWAYLQCVLIYGKVPLVTEPVVTKLQSDASYPMVELADVCEYFIKDLAPYNTQTIEYPDYNSIGGDIDPRSCFFPPQVVMGDLYLYLAVANHDKEAAKLSAQNYYKYIVWDRSSKTNTVTGNARVSWDASSLRTERYSVPTGSLNYNTKDRWGAANTSLITAIPMDSAAADGYYNELKNLYNFTDDTDFKEASILPSEPLRQLSKEQTYVDWDMEKHATTPTEDKFEDRQLERQMIGDLRFYHNCTSNQSNMTYNGKEYKLRFVRKHNLSGGQSQHIRIYSTPQVYLRMAEALNYAGYPRFAKQILVMGLSDNVIAAEVLPYYETAEDSAYIQSFVFNNNTFKPYADQYTIVKNSHRVVTSINPTFRSNYTDVNMIGIHSRGSGLAFLNSNYCSLVMLPGDSVSYPQALEDQIGEMPLKTAYEWPTKPKAITAVKKPTTWDKFGNVTVSQEEYYAHNADWLAEYTEARKKAFYTNYTRQDKEGLDSVGRYNKYLTVTVPAYEAEMAQYNSDYAASYAIYRTDSLAFEGRMADFHSAFYTWHRNLYTSDEVRTREAIVIDQAILDEQALELAFEGNRFFDLMRRAMWYGDANKLAGPVSKRNAAAGAKLLEKKNWYLNWKGKIGY